MGKIKQGLLGGVSGKVGPTVGSSWKGIPVLKALPLSVANPRTAGQVAQRTKMTNVVAFSQSILATVIKPLWDRFAQQASGYNEFVSANISLFADTLPAPVEDLIISRGKMAATPIETFGTGLGQSNIGVGWTDDSGEGLKLATDTLFVVYVNPVNGQVEGFNTGVERQAEAAVINVGSAFANEDPFYGYFAFRRADGTVVSDSVYKLGVFGG